MVVSKGNHFIFSPFLNFQSEVEKEPQLSTIVKNRID